MRVIERNEWCDVLSRKIPETVGFIMDGNGRWAEMRGQRREEGHFAGGDAFRCLIREAAKLPIKTVLVYAFSSGNWKRESDEVSHLMAFYHWLLTEDDVQWFERHSIQLEYFGNTTDPRLPKATRDWIVESTERTKHGTALQLVVVFNPDQYSELKPTSFPPLDLLVRTGGDERLSSFLPLSTQNAELVFMDTLWPDFQAGHLYSVINEYQTRSRRFGGAMRAQLPATDEHEASEHETAEMRL